MTLILLYVASFAPLLISLISIKMKKVTGIRGSVVVSLVVLIFQLLLTQYPVWKAHSSFLFFIGIVVFLFTLSIMMFWNVITHKPPPPHIPGHPDSDHYK